MLFPASSPRKIFAIIPPWYSLSSVNLIVFVADVCSDLRFMEMSLCEILFILYVHFKTSLSFSLICFRLILKQFAWTTFIIEKLSWESEFLVRLFLPVFLYSTHYYHLFRMEYCKEMFILMCCGWRSWKPHEQILTRSWNETCSMWCNK